jgi:hypothetical protein
MLLTLLGPQGTPPPVTAVKVWLNVSGVWKECVVWINVGGTWKTVTTWLNVGGTWK